MNCGSITTITRIFPGKGRRRDEKLNTKDLIEQVRNIHAVGRNYADHARELKNPVPEEPVIFAKSPACLTTSERLAFPPGIGPIHLELEVVMRLGEALPVDGFANLNCVSHLALGIDFTARELQNSLKKKGLPWHRAKNFADACWLGPLREGVPAEPFSFSLTQNGAVRQSGFTADMIFGFAEILAFINKTMPLETGDLIFTGTPAGVGPVVPGDLPRLLCPALHTDITLVIADAI
jgi:2-keto-4-pentenoate hydratase/2-oxohepta-3-ene-1,7-dioic acid hydratase in catechol pathway